MGTEKIDPYQPCPCASGRKYKFCCRLIEAAISSQAPGALVKKSLEFPVSLCVGNVDWQA